MGTCFLQIVPDRCRCRTFPLIVRIAFMPIAYCLRHITYALPTYCLRTYYTLPARGNW